MNALLGWALAALALGLGWWRWGAPGLALAATLIVFWLLLQFTRSLRVMRTAARRPLGQVASAVMFAASLRPGLSLLALVQRTRSLGERVDQGEGGVERWRWRDAYGASVTLEFARGRLRCWTLQRADDQASAPSTGSPPASAGAAAAPADTGSAPSSR